MMPVKLVVGYYAVDTFAQYREKCKQQLKESAEQIANESESIWHFRGLSMA